MKRLVSLWLPVVLWCGVIFGLSNIPHLRFTTAWWDYPLRKLAHMVEYGILALLFARALKGSTTWSRRTIFALALSFSVLYAATDEYHQTFIAGRHGTPRDVIFDTVGATVALILPL